jgi:hypothetical protein
MTAALEKYKTLLQRLHDIQECNPYPQVYEARPEEDAVLDLLDIAWDELTDEDREELDV